MSQLTISEQIRSLRKAKGLSQEALAENAGINLRTLQRIETGHAAPRGETLRLLARALDVSVQDLSESVEAPPVAMEDDPGFLRLMSLSALTLWFIPFGNILIPLAFWVLKKNKINGVAELGRRIINFQIIWTVVTYGLAILNIFPAFLGQIYIDPFVMMPIMLLFFIANTVYIIIITKKIPSAEREVLTQV
ncbi:helix-turn-helix domain-containing protein [Dyadobacter fanqingshengii]|uniref:Helix-turn-helix domain-containing protein n=1 Tax=Dyadobacter fanqingshengii TaxID=2906443 RepID=A0A9X1TAC1_9BACT|nr:helix-turn-helix domain-containing protein [Dyadobacter fanqingshengii]MCF0040804.1 helix-turn-helix domain-containing protein [Dyadobacter fanqingshengii]USJ37461.1 helix-turn-helix domain-containing protein [Dyadobacter fanqingshengii]